MIVYNGVPPPYFQDDGFRLLNDNFAKNLEIQFGRQAIRSMVLKKFEEEKSKFKGSLSGDLVSIKFDGVTRLRSYFLGISVQYYDEEHGVTIRDVEAVIFQTLPLPLPLPPTKNVKTNVDNFFNFCGSVACLLHFINWRKQKPSFIAITLPTSLELIVSNYSVLVFLRYQNSC